VHGTDGKLGVVLENDGRIADDGSAGDDGCADDDGGADDEGGNRGPAKAGQPTTTTATCRRRRSRRRQDEDTDARLAGRPREAMCGRKWMPCSPLEILRRRRQIKEAKCTRNAYTLPWGTELQTAKDGNVVGSAELAIGGPSMPIQWLLDPFPSRSVFGLVNLWCLQFVVVRRGRPDAVLLL